MKPIKPEPKSAVNAILDAIVAIVIMAIVVNALMAMVAPYAPHLVIATALVLIGGLLYRQRQRW